MSFEDKQKSYYLQEINRALPTRSTPSDLKTLNAALQITDPVMPHAGIRQLSDAEKLVSNFGLQTDAQTKDANCRSVLYPGTSMRTADARTGCGWWFVDEPTIPSSGAYGSRRGPMTPFLDTQVGPGRWIWDTEDAYKQESMKQADSIKACPDIQFKRIDTIGWCPSTGRAVVTDGNGRPAFPQARGGDCPGGKIIMNAGSCPPPPPPDDIDGGGVEGGNVALSSSTTYLCKPKGDGSLAPACIQNLANYYCSSSGSLSRALSGGNYAGSSDEFNSSNYYLQQRNFTIDSGIVNDGKTSIWNVLTNTWALRRTANSGDNSRSTQAARHLCTGAPFNPCVIAPHEKAPFNPMCITRACIAAGYSADGDLLPAKIGMKYWNALHGHTSTWQEVLNNIAWYKGTADQKPGYTSNPEYQPGAIRAVYGVNVKMPKKGCNNIGIAMYRYLGMGGGATIGETRVGFDLTGHDFRQVNPPGGSTTAVCAEECKKDSNCGGFTSVTGGTCYLKTPGASFKPHPLGNRLTSGYINKGDSSSSNTLFPVTGCSTHFLGRYLFKTGIPTKWTVNALEQTPAGGYGVENQRLVTNFRPKEGGTYQFVLVHMYTSSIRMMLNGITTTATSPESGKPTPITTLQGQKDYPMVIDLIRSSPNWSLAIYMSVNGRGWEPIPADLFYLPEDRRNPMIEMAFNKMPDDSTGLATHRNAKQTDTYGIFSNLFRWSAPIGTLNGRRCMLVGQTTSGVFNYAKINQGIRFCAMKSFTLMFQIDSVTYANITPTLLSFFNPAGTNPLAGVHGQQPNIVNSATTRQDDFEITLNQEVIYPWTFNPGSKASAFMNNINSGNVGKYQKGQWTHLAWVWNDDFAGYTMYITTGSANNPSTAIVSGFCPAYSPTLIMENIRVGGDNQQIDKCQWTGGIAWFRAFDYRLSQAQALIDFKDEWEYV